MSGRESAYASVEICAGAGGQAVGLHDAGFSHRALIEVDPHAVQTLRHNTSKQGWENCEILEEDLTNFDPADLKKYIDSGENLALLSGGVPCPPFSMAGKRLGADDDRDLFPAMLEMVKKLNPRAVMIENVRGLLDEQFRGYREQIMDHLKSFGYTILGWELLEARDFGVPQLRPRSILVAMQEPEAQYFHPAREVKHEYKVIAALEQSMRDRFLAVETRSHEEAMAAFERWRVTARAKGTVAPTLVGGSKKHGGADLGPTRAKRAWEELGVDAHGVAEPLGHTKDEDRDLFGERGPKLTVAQAALVQGFPEHWEFMGGKTAAYRQVGNAFPPLVAQAVGESIIAALRAADRQETPPVNPDQGLVSEDRQLELSAG